MGLCFCARAFSTRVTSGGHSSSQCVGLSLSRPLLLRSTGSSHAGSVVVAHGPSRSTACGILPDQGSNPRPLHRQADSQPLRHQGSPNLSLLNGLMDFLYFDLNQSCLLNQNKKGSCMSQSQNATSTSPMGEENLMNINHRDAESITGLLSHYQNLPWVLFLVYIWLPVPCEPWCVLQWRSPWSRAGEPARRTATPVKAKSGLSLSIWKSRLDSVPKPAATWMWCPLSSPCWRDFPLYEWVF